MVKNEVWKDPFREKVNSLMTVNVGDSTWWKKHEEGVWDNCNKPIKVDSSQDDFKEIFPDATFSARKAVADTFYGKK